MAPPAANAPVVAYLALGSNLGDRVGNLLAARQAIGTIPGCSILAASSLYASAAWGTQLPQPDYLNAVIAVTTSLAPVELLRKTAGIEQSHGRIRGPDQFASRTLDIDLLLVGDNTMNTAELRLPHPRMHLRAFVLLPLLELAPNVEIPRHGALALLLKQLSNHGVTKVGQNSAWI